MREDNFVSTSTDANFNYGDSEHQHDKHFLDELKSATAPNQIHKFGQNVEKIDYLYDNLKETYYRKNHDYGNSFEDGLNEDGLIFAKMHLMEKYNRFKMLINDKNQVQDEGIKDSLLDMANYAIMTAWWMDKQNNKI